MTSSDGGARVSGPASRDEGHPRTAPPAPDRRGLPPGERRAYGADDLQLSLAAVARRTFVATTVAAATLVLLLFAWQVRTVLLVGFAGVLFAILLRGGADVIARYTPLSTKVCVMLMGVLIFGSLALAIWWRGPHIAAELQTLGEQLPAALQQLRARAEQYEVGRRALENIPPITALVPDASTAVERATGIASFTMRILLNTTIIIFLGILLAFTPRVYVGGALRIIPPDRRAHTHDVLDRLTTALRRWLAAQLIAMAFVGTMTGVGLWLLGMPLAFTLGLIAGVTDFIPYVGPILSGIPGVLLAFVVMPDKLLSVFILYVVVQSIESYILVPYLQWRVVYIPPALMIFAQLSLGAIAGMWGIALAAPLTAATMVLVQELWVKPKEEAAGMEAPSPDGALGSQTQ